MIDINDNKPKFSKDAVNLNISEATAVESKYHLGSATDSDSSPFNVQGYKIVSGNLGETFSVKNRTIEQQVFADLVLKKPLDRETTSHYALVVKAFDGDSPPKSGSMVVNVNILDDNDNPPTFNLSRYTVPMSEDQEVGEDVITLTATDIDEGVNSQISYHIDRTQSDPTSVFEVDSQSGRIYLNQKLDFENKVQHKIILVATDGGAEPLSGSTVVIVDVGDVNDNKPTINVIFLENNKAEVSLKFSVRVATFDKLAF